MRVSTGTIQEVPHLLVILTRTNSTIAIILKAIPDPSIPRMTIPTQTLPTNITPTHTTSTTNTAIQTFPNTASPTTTPPTMTSPNHSYFTENYCYHVSRQAVLTPINSGSYVFFHSQTENLSHQNNLNETLDSELFWSKASVAVFPFKASVLHRTHTRANEYLICTTVLAHDLGEWSY